jgi:hypothetical protein
MAAEILRYVAEDDMPQLARLELDGEGGLTCVFADETPVDAAATA